MEKYKLIIPAEVKSQLKDAISRFDTFISLLNLMIKNGVNVDALKDKVESFGQAGKELIKEIDNLG